MTNEQVSAQELLFGMAGLSATNFKMFPGADRELNAMLVKEEIRRSLESLITSDSIDECIIED